MDTRPAWSRGARQATVPAPYGRSGASLVAPDCRRELRRRVLLAAHPRRDRPLGLVELVRRTELQQLGPRVHVRTVAGRLVEGVARFVDLLVVVEDEAHPPREDIAPMRTLAGTTRQCLQRPVKVGVGGERDEVDRVAAKLLATIGHGSR